MPTTPAVFVFIQAGCGACHDYMPKFEHVAAPYRGQLAIGVYDIAANNRRWHKLAEAMGVSATPTTVVQTSNGAHKRFVGSLPIGQIREAFALAR